MNAFNAQMQQLAFWSLVGQLFVGTIFLWLMYLITKNAIRDGIKESGLITAILETRTKTDETGTPVKTLRNLL